MANIIDKQSVAFKAKKVQESSSRPCCNITGLRFIDLSSPCFLGIRQAVLIYPSSVLILCSSNSNPALITFSE